MSLILSLVLDPEPTAPTSLIGPPAALTTSPSAPAANASVKQRCRSARLALIVHSERCITPPGRQCQCSARRSRTGLRKASDCRSITGGHALG